MKKLEKSVEGGLAFHLCNGKVVSSVKELYDEIHHMTEDVFGHHVTADRNDFSNWVKDVFGEKKLSQNIAKAATPTMLKRVLSSVFADEKAGTAKTVKTPAPKAAAKTAAPKAAAKAAAPKAASKAAAPKAAAKAAAPKAAVKAAAPKAAVKAAAPKAATKAAAKPAVKKAK